jgi:hypothetical protein
MRALSLAAVSATLAGCCFSPMPVTPIAPPPATTVVAGGGPQLPSTTPAEAIGITPGFTDPMIFHGLAGGPRAASNFSPDCRGQVPMQPSHRFRLDASFPYLRIMARGEADLTLVVRSPGGMMRCNDDSDGLNPVVEGAFEPGVYEVYVGLYSAGTATPYDLGVSSNASIQPTTMLGATSTVPTAIGATLRSGVLTVSTSDTSLAATGDVCTYSEVSVAPTSGGSDVRWTITCGTTIVYGAGNGGYGRSTDVSWPPGTIAYDLETTSGDTDPAFEWTSSSLRVSDDATGSLGAMRIDFVVPGS